MSYWTNHYSDSMLATAWTCSECHEDTFEADSYPVPKYCCHCGAEIVAVDNMKAVRLIAGESITLDPRQLWPDYKSENAEPVTGTFTVESDEGGTSCTVNLISKNGESNEQTKE